MVLPQPTGQEAGQQVCGRQAAGWIDQSENSNPLPELLPPCCKSRMAQNFRLAIDSLSDPKAEKTRDANDSPISCINFFNEWLCPSESSAVSRKKPASPGFFQGRLKKVSVSGNIRQSQRSTAFPKETGRLNLCLPIMGSLRRTPERHSRFIR